MAGSEYARMPPGARAKRLNKVSPTDEWKQSEQNSFIRFLAASASLFMHQFPTRRQVCVAGRLDPAAQQDLDLPHSQHSLHTIRFKVMGFKVIAKSGL